MGCLPAVQRLVHGGCPMASQQGMSISTCQPTPSTPSRPPCPDSPSLSFWPPTTSGVRLSLPAGEPMHNPTLARCPPHRADRQALHVAARPLDLLLTYRSCWCAKVARLFPLVVLQLVTLRHESRHPWTKMGIAHCWLEKWWIHSSLIPLGTMCAHGTGSEHPRSPPNRSCEPWMWGR